MKTPTLRLIAILEAFSVASPAVSAVVSGEITFLKQGHTGAFVELDGAGDFTVGQNNFDQSNLYAFDEKQSVKLEDDLALDNGIVLSKGLTVSSHYVFYDPLNASHQRGWVEFDGDILGVATTPLLLGESDFLASETVNYIGSNLRGLETKDTATIDPTNGKRLLVDWRAGNPGDYLRVVTTATAQEVIATPVPASIALLGAGLAALYGFRRKV